MITEILLKIIQLSCTGERKGKVEGMQLAGTEDWAMGPMEFVLFCSPLSYVFEIV